MNTLFQCIICAIPWYESILNALFYSAASFTHNERQIEEPVVKVDGSDKLTHISDNWLMSKS